MGTYIRKAVGSRVPYSPHCEPAQSGVSLKHLAASFKIPERTGDVLPGDPLEDEGTAESEKWARWLLVILLQLIYPPGQRIETRGLSCRGMCVTSHLLRDIASIGLISRNKQHDKIDTSHDIVAVS